MIEFDKTLEPLVKIINECYDNIFIGYSAYPKFSFTRAMIILWKYKVYSKIKTNLNEALVSLLNNQRNNAIKRGEIKTENHHKFSSSQSLGPFKNIEECINIQDYSKSCFISNEPEITGDSEVDLIGRFVQSIVDLSTNELTIHFLGHTKSIIEEPYNELSRIIFSQTKYFYLLTILIENFIEKLGN